MTKVKTKLVNPFFLEEAGEYLEANGYKRSDGEIVENCIYFFNGSKAVNIYGDNADFMFYQDGEPYQRRAAYSRYMALTGIGDLDLFKWMLMFHIADIVPLKKFVKEVRKAPAADVTGFMVQIFDHFRVTETPDAVPINY